jgi:hypothetical protein
MESEPYKRIAEIKHLTGYQIKLQPLEAIQKVIISEDRIAVSIRVVEAAESTTRYRVKKTGRRLIEWKKRPGTLGWMSWFRDEETVWDEEKVDWVHYKHSNAELSDQIRRDQQVWEDAAYRPGRGRFPMDRAENADHAVWLIDNK